MLSDTHTQSIRINSQNFSIISAASRNCTDENKAIICRLFRFLLIMAIPPKSTSFQVDLSGESFVDVIANLAAPGTWKTIAQVSAISAILSGTYCVLRSCDLVFVPPWNIFKHAAGKRRLPPPKFGPLKQSSSIDSVQQIKSQSATVSKLLIYPIKSCGGIEVESYFCGDLGPQLHTEYGVVRDR